MLFFFSLFTKQIIKKHIKDKPATQGKSLSSESWIFEDF